MTSQGLAPDPIISHSGACCLQPEILTALRLLLRAADYAADAGGDPWQFAVELRDLHASGLTRHDLRWLLAKGFAQHAQETTAPGDPARNFRPLPSTAVPPHTCVVLTPTGTQALRPYITLAAAVSTTTNSRLAPRDDSLFPPLPPGEGRGEGSPAHQHAPRSAPNLPIAPEPYPHFSPAVPPLDNSKPEWDPNRRELRFRGKVVKRFRTPAPNQERILAAFQEDGWPESIDDPLPQNPAQDPKRRLQGTIKSLNRNQLHSLIRFHGNGHGDHIYWEPLQ